MTVLLKSMGGESRRGSTPPPSAKSGTRDQIAINARISATMKAKGIRPPSRKATTVSIEVRNKISLGVKARIAESKRGVPRLRICGFCGGENKKRNKFFCSGKCAVLDRSARIDIDIESGKVVEKRRLRKFLLRKAPFCRCCGLSEWLGKPLALQIHHIDFNSENNVLGNVELLCPNCHSQTENYTGKGSRGTKRNFTKRKSP